MATSADIVRDAARLHAGDFYLSALLAPRAARDDLIALAAYHGEVARIPLTVSEPMLGQIRLQWWRDAIEAASPESASGNPIADALSGVARRLSLIQADLIAPLDAGDHLLAHGTFESEREFSEFIAGSWTTMFRISARILEPHNSAEDEAAIAAAGDAYGRARVAADLPLFIARGLCPVPFGAYGIADPRGAGEAQAVAAVSEATRRLVLESEACLTRAKQMLPAASWSVRAASRPVALVEPYLRALQRPDRNRLTSPADVAPLVRVWRLWLARWRDSV